MSSRLTVMKTLIRTLAFCVLLMATPAAAQQQPTPAQPTTPPATAQPRPPAARDEFVPVNDLPDSEKLPAAPYLIAAYMVVWLVLLGYVWSLWRRLTQVEQELKQAVQSASRDA
jgi:CcmD family protein